MIKRFASLRASGGLALALLSCGIAGLPASAQECEVKIGAVGPLTGGAAAWGLSAVEGAKFAAAVVNEEGGLKIGDKKCQVKVYEFDAKYTAAGGAAAADYLASANVHLAIGPIGSPETTGFRPAAKRSGIINFSTSYMRDAMTPEFPLAFHAYPAPITWGPLLIKEADAQFGFKSVLITAPNDQGGTDAGKQLVKLYGDVGVKATEDYYQRGTTNFAPLATRIMNANPDAIEISSVPPADSAILIKQLLEAGYDGVIGSLGGTGINPIVEAAGGVANLHNVYWLETSPVDHPGIVKLKNEYKRLMGRDAPENPLFPVCALAAEVALKGISSAGTDQDAEKIAEALRALIPESRYMGKAGWRGKTLYQGVNQELTFPVGLGLIVKGEKHPVKTIDIPSE